MHFRRFLITFALIASVWSIGAPVDAAKRSGRSTKAAASSGSGTVHVKGYTRKDGTTVKAHDRAAPKSKGAAAAAPRAKGATAANGRSGKTPKTGAVAVARDDRGRIKRSESARHAFEVQTGYPHGRPGYVIDHVKPLACGGADAPSNMQWQTIEQAKAKDRVERIGC